MALTKSEFDRGVKSALDEPQVGSNFRSAKDGLVR